MKRHKDAIIKISLFLILLVFVKNAGASQNIILWHSLDGPLEKKFTEMVERFNQKPEIVKTDAKVVLLYKGKYEETLTTGLNAVKTGHAPHILQVYEMGNLVMQANPKTYVPLNKLTSKPSTLLSNEKFIPFFNAFYKGRQGDQGLQSLPFSASTVILFYNKDAFKKAGLDHEHPPTTWEEFEKIAAVLKAQGAHHVLAAGWLSGHHIDHMAAWHNRPVATKGNGMDGDGAKLLVNRPFFIYHLDKLADWYRAGIFSLVNRVKAEEAFAKGEVIMLTHGANRLPMIEKLVNGKFQIGVGYFPYWKNKIKEPQNTIAGGASFWAIAGHKPKDYEVIQQFFEYLASEPLQAEWHQETYYMPVVVGAEAIAKDNKFYEQGLKGRAAKLALDSFAGHPPKEFSRGILLPNYHKVREVMVQEMQEAIKGHKSPEEALEQIVVVGNKIMQKKE